MYINLKYKLKKAWETLFGSSANAAYTAWRLARRREAFGRGPLLLSTGSPLLQAACGAWRLARRRQAFGRGPLLQSTEPTLPSATWIGKKPQVLDFSTCNQSKWKGEKKDNGKECTEHERRSTRKERRYRRETVLLQSTHMESRRQRNIDHAAANR